MSVCACVNSVCNASVCDWPSCELGTICGCRQSHLTLCVSVCVCVCVCELVCVCEHGYCVMYTCHLPNIGTHVKRPFLRPRLCYDALEIVLVLLLLLSG